MEKESDIDFAKPLTNKQIIIFALIAVLVCGFILGFTIGGYSMQQKWENYFEDLKERLSDDARFLKSIGDDTNGNFKNN